MKARLLVIDDDPDLRALLKVVLGRFGNYEVEVARTGAEGVAAAKASAFQIVVLDMTLPDADGADVFTQLKANDPEGRLKIVILSAVAGRATTLPAADGVIAKPFKPAQLLEQLKQVLQPR